MTDTQEQPTGAEPAEVEVTEAEAPRLTARNSQAAYDANRRERKARAAVTVEANAKEAQAAKKKVQAKASRPKGTAAFEKRAKEIEAQHEASRKAKADK
ncbi:hypothetical protein SEA_HASITHA_9 [Microbacterium phage Hasitha]|nr:hypothetical protein SEA_HASITHA_9 [Microbacterium phage Hasitha]